MENRRRRRKKKEKIEEVLDMKIVDTRRGRYNGYLIKWKGLLQEDNTWITKEEIRNLDREKWQRFEVE